MKPRMLLLACIALLLATVNGECEEWQLEAGDSAPQFAKEKTLLNITDFAPGTYLLTILPSGQVEASRVSVIEVGDAPTDPGTTPPVTVNRVAAIKKVVDQIDDPEMTKNLAPLFRGIAIKSRPPNALYTTPENLKKGVQDSLNLFLSIGGSESEWSPFKDALTSEWTKIAQEGGKLEDYAKLVDDVAAALSQSANLEESAFDITVVFKILEIIGNPNLTRFQKLIAIAPLIFSMFI